MPVSIRVVIKIIFSFFIVSFLVLFVYFGGFQRFSALDFFPKQIPEDRSEQSVFEESVVDGFRFSTANLSPNTFARIDRIEDGKLYLTVEGQKRAYPLYERVYIVCARLPLINANEVQGQDGAINLSEKEGMALDMSNFKVDNLIDAGFDKTVFSRSEAQTFLETAFIGTDSRVNVIQTENESYVDSILLLDKDGCLK